MQERYERAGLYPGCRAVSGDAGVCGQPPDERFVREVGAGRACRVDVVAAGRRASAARQSDSGGDRGGQRRGVYGRPLDPLLEEEPCRGQSLWDAVPGRQGPARGRDAPFSREDQGQRRRPQHVVPVETLHQQPRGRFQLAGDEGHTSSGQRRNGTAFQDRHHRQNRKPLGGRPPAHRRRRGVQRNGEEQESRYGDDLGGQGLRRQRLFRGDRRWVVQCGVSAVEMAAVGRQAGDVHARRRRKQARCLLNTNLETGRRHPRQNRTEGHRLACRRCDPLQRGAQGQRGQECLDGRREAARW